LDNFITIFISYFAIVLSLFLLTYYTGNGILKLFPNRNTTVFFSNVFFKILTGAAAIITIVSLIYTGGKTVNLLLLLILFFLFIERYLNRQNIVTTEHSEITEKKTSFTLKHFFLLFIPILLVFLWESNIVLKIDEYPFHFFERDNLFYSEVSKCLVTTGQENIFTSGNLINERYNFPTPYHYFDLWLNGFVSKIFGLNYGLSLYLVTYTFFTALFLFGLLALIEKYDTPKFIHIFITLLLLFIGGVHITDIIGMSGHNAQMESITERYGEKLGPAYCFALAVVLLFNSGNIKTALIVLLCLSVVSVSIAPAVCFGVASFCVLNIFKKGNDKNFYLRLLIYTSLIVASGVLFYFLTEQILNRRTVHPFENYTDLKSLSFYSFKFYIVELFLKCYREPLFFFINYLPFGLIIILLMVSSRVSSNINILFRLFALIWLAGLVTCNTLYLLNEAWQFYTNTLVLWHVLFACGIIIFWFEINSRYKISSNILLIICFGSLIYKSVYSFISYKKLSSENLIFSKSYLLKVNDEFKNTKYEMKGAVLFDESYYKNVANVYPYEYYSFPGIKNPKVYIPFNLTYANSIPKENLYQKVHYLAFNPFNQYVDEQNDSAGTADILKLQIKFIKKNNIKYLICPAGAQINPDSFPEIKKIIHDPLSGQSLVLLK